jgi:hypothetical protein
MAIPHLLPFTLSVGRRAVETRRPWSARSAAGPRSGGTHGSQAAGPPADRLRGVRTGRSAPPGGFPPPRRSPETSCSCARPDGPHGRCSRPPDAAPRVEHVEDQRRVHADGRMQARRRLPRAVAHARPRTRPPCRWGAAGSSRCSDQVARVGELPATEHLHALDRGIDEAHRAATRRFLAQHVPRLKRLAQFDLHAAVGHRAEPREAELEVRARTRRTRRGSPPPAGRPARPRSPARRSAAA